MRKVSIIPVHYRIGNGVNLQISEYKGALPLTAVWQITTDTGHVLEQGDYTFLQSEWDNWPAGDDNYYPERIVAAVLGLSIVE